jgi:hypothetical protein
MRCGYFIDVRCCDVVHQNGPRVFTEQSVNTQRTHVCDISAQNYVLAHPHLPLTPTVGDDGIQSLSDGQAPGTIPETDVVVHYGLRHIPVRAQKILNEKKNKAARARNRSNVLIFVGRT